MKTNYGKILKWFYYISIGLFTISAGGLFIYRQQVSADEFSSSSLQLFIKEFYPWALTVSAGLAVIMLIYSGYLYVTSAGNMDQVNRAKEYIIGALSGLAFLILAALIYNSLKT